MVAVPEVPEEMAVQLRRTDFIRRKLVDRLPDS